MKINKKEFFSICIKEIFKINKIHRLLYKLGFREKIAATCYKSFDCNSLFYF